MRPVRLPDLAATNSFSPIWRAFFTKTRRACIPSCAKQCNSEMPTNIRMSAHALKGLVAGCGGVRAASAAQKVETAGHENDLSNIEPLVESLGEELELLRQATCRRIATCIMHSASALATLRTARLRPAPACRSTLSAIELCCAGSRA